MRNRVSGICAAALVSISFTAMPVQAQTAAPVPVQAPVTVPMTVPAPAPVQSAPVQMPPVVAAPAPAPANDACAEGGKLMQQRQGLIQGLQANKGRKMTPVAACGKFNALVDNGKNVIAWLEKSGAWCGAPDGLIENVKADHEKAIGIRGQACGAAAKYKQLMARAKAQARQAQQGPGRLGGSGGDVVSGQMRVPAGAL